MLAQEKALHPPRTGKALFVSRDASQRDALLREIRRTCRDSEGAADRAEAIAALGAGGFDILVHDAEEALDFPFLDACRQAAPGIVPVLLTRGALHHDLQEIMARPHLRHFIAVRDGIPVRELGATLSKLTGAGVFGLRPYLVDGAEEKVIEVSDSRDKEAYVQEGLEFLKASRFPARGLPKLGTIMDEAIMNMVYDAPKDRDGRHLFKHLPRTERVRLDPAQAGRLTLAFDGSHLAISARDPFGGLALGTFWRYLDKCFHAKEQIGSEGAGAGLGLYLVYSFCSQFVMNVKPGEITEFVLVSSPRAEGPAGQKAPKSVHYFEA